MSLHDVLQSNREEIIARWKQEVVQGTFAPEAMPSPELENHMPRFVDEIVAALRQEAGLTSPAPLFDDNGSTAAGHGAQRLRLGFSLDAVVREYGCLRKVILETASASGVDPTFREVQSVFDVVIDGIASAVTEYTQQREAEMARQANEHFAFIAHELRNPLSSVVAGFRLLERQGQLPSESRAVVSIEQGLERMRSLIDQTLQNARVASGIELRKDTSTLTDLLEFAEREATTEAESKSVELRTAIENDDTIVLDTRLVRSAVGNLLRNAVRHTRAGGTVELRGQIANARAVIEVEDCCGGLEPGQVEQAFAPFVRFDTRQGGFGLGLAIAKQAVDAHGGTIRVQNLPGKGCIFVLELPVAS